MAGATLCRPPFFSSSLSVKAGMITAQTAYKTLAKIFSCDGDVTPNIVMALRWLEKFIENGSNKAACAVAKIFRGVKFSVPQDGEKALEISGLALKIKLPPCA